MKKALYLTFALLVLALLPAGCGKSPFISATIINNSGAAVSLIEVDYPSASFGVGSLAAGATFHYRFKVQGAGEIKMQFTDTSGKAHTVTGPELSEGQQGTLTISIAPGNAVAWTPALHRKH